MVVKNTGEAPPRQRDFLEEVMTEKLDSIKFTDKATAEASGPQIVIVPTQDGRQDLRVGWQLTVWLAHNPVLLGQGPVGVTVPLGGLDPPEEMVKMITERLLEEARKVRQKVNAPPATPDAEEMMEALRRNAAENGQGQLPPM